MTLPLTATVITFNEERNIRQCLESLAWVPHLIVIDSGSSDRTVEIAKQFTDHVVVTDWPGHVQQKNRAIDRSHTDWVLCVDADERVTPEMRQQIEALFEPGLPPCAGYTVRRKTRYLGRWILHGGWYPDRKLRLFDRQRGRWGGTNPHDHVHVDGSIEDLDADLLHYTYRDIRHHLEVIDFFTEIAARERDLAGQRPSLLRLVFNPPFKFTKMYFIKRGYKDGFAGFIIAVLGGLYVFLKDAKLWERKRLQGRGLDPDAMPRYHRGPEWRPSSPRHSPPRPSPPHAEGATDDNAASHGGTESAATADSMPNSMPNSGSCSIATDTPLAASAIPPTEGPTR